MNRVLFFSHFAGLYGAQRSLLMIIEGLDRGIFKPQVICADRGELVDEVRELGVPLSYIPRPQWSVGIHFSLRGFFEDVRYFVRLLQVLLKNRPACFYINTVAHLHPLLASWLLRVPVILHVQEPESYFQLNSWRKKVRIFLFAKIPVHIICLSQETARQLYVVGFEKEDTSIVFNAVHVRHLQPDLNLRSRTRRKLGIDAKQVVVGFVGSVTRAKGIDVCLKAFARYYRQDESAVLLVVGGVPRQEEEELLKLIQQLGVKNAVKLLGFQKQTKPYYAAMDVLVMPSREESFGLVNVEAMAMEVPVIASRVGGIPEVVVDRQTGYLVEKDDIRGFTKRLKDLARDNDQRQRMGSNGRQRVMREFSHADFVRRIQQIIEGNLRGEK